MVWINKQIPPLKLWILAFFTVCMASCQFHQSIEKDIKTGAYQRGDGLSCDNVDIAINGVTTDRTEYVYGEKVEFLFENLRGFERIDGKSFPEMAIYIVANSKDTISKDTNLLKSLKDGASFYPIQASANFRASFPYKNSESYEVHIQISDTKAEGNFTYILPFTIVANDFLEPKVLGLTYEDVYLWDETLNQPIQNKEIAQNHDFTLVIEGLKGFSETDKKIHPIFSIEIKDNEDNIILSSPDILSLYEEQGVTVEQLSEQLIASFNFNSGKTFNPCTLFAKVEEPLTGNFLEIRSTLILK